MKVAIFTDTFTPQINGVAKTYQRLIEYLHSQNVETKVFAPASGGEDKEKNGANIIRFFSCDFFLYPDCKIAVPNYFHIHRSLDNFKPDLIHIATPFVLGIAGLNYANATLIPKVAVFHTNFPQYLDYYRMPWLKKLSWRFLRWFHRQMDRNYCPSRDTMRLLARHSIGNLEIWSRGVDYNSFNPAWRSEELRRQYGVSDKTVLLYVGRLAPEKSVDVLLKALDVANSACNDLHLLVVGDGPLRHELETIAPHNVTFLGYKSGKELAAIYASADIFACPSVTETFGNVILEAMASSLPVVAPLAGGIKENLIAMKTGLSCLPLNHFSMAASIVRLAQDKELQYTLAVNACVHAKAQSWDAIFSRLLQSYVDVVNNSKHKHHNKAI